VCNDISDYCPNCQEEWVCCECDDDWDDYLDDDYFDGDDGWDEDYDDWSPVCGEDLELCLRVWL
jgi:hypothetical protein